MNRTLLGFVAALALAALTTLATAPAATAQANLAFAGGNGTPLTLTLTAPITYTITVEATGFFFVFDATGDYFGEEGVQTTGTIMYSVNGGAAQTINGVASGGNYVDLTADDTLLGGNPLPSSAGDTVTLTAGTLTTTGNFAGAAPTGGSFTTFLLDQDGALASGNGVAGAAAPEPSALALVLPALPLAGVVLRRRRRRV